MGFGGGGGGGRGALEGKGPERQSQKRLDRWLEEVAKAVGGGYCRLQMPLRLALGVKGTVAGHRLGGGLSGGGYLPPFQCIPLGGLSVSKGKLRPCAPVAWWVDNPRGARLRLHRERRHVGV